MGTQKGRETYELLKMGALDGMSIGFKADPQKQGYNENKRGVRTGSSIVRKHGFKRNGLRPKQYEHLNPVYAHDFKEVVKKEVELAEKLRKRKHFVHQN